MEYKDIKALLKKYENAATTVDEENILKLYFEANKTIAEGAIFDFYTNEQKISTSITMKPEAKVVPLKWKIPAIAATFVLGMIFATYWMGDYKRANRDDLGTFTNPDEAYIETIKALKLVSVELNKGIDQAKYLNEYENTKNIIFKK
jgi:hypothetical protein